ncbi:MAG TPA: type II secretion system protein [Candidatus Sulfotelmatobacter sp.]|jgi:general secretion pathway protein G|nr:type II secretion system protein [Candidatus Sulfotelmatobacter sp.]
MSRIFSRRVLRQSPRPRLLTSGLFRRARPIAAGMTLIELILACAILLILATSAIPLARVTVKRHKEDALRYDLRQMRDAIDRYKDAADKGQIQVQAGTEGYPPDLQTLVHGVPLTGVTGKNIRFLRRIPTDPMTGNQDWGMRSVQDDTDSSSWGGQDVFDVFTKSSGTALNGTKYSEW